MTHLVLVGGGHAHVQVLRRLAMRRIPGARVTVVLDRPAAVYSGMVPGFVAGQYRQDEIEIDVVPLARRAGARVVLSPATGIDARARRIEIAGRPPLPYDLASLDVGSTTAGLDLPGVRAHALPTRPVSALVARLDELGASIPARDGRAPHVVAAGGGAAGVELAFTVARRLRAGGAPASVTLVHRPGELLAGAPRSLADRVRAHAALRRIVLVAGAVAAAARDHVALDGGDPLPCDLLLWATGAAGQPWLAASGLPADAAGFVHTRPTLQVDGHDDLFAVGDCALLLAHPDTPKAGVYAVREGPVLIANLRARAAGRRLASYRPQSDFLALLNLGDGTALGAKWGRSFEGRWVWRMKDRIDRRFVRRFQVLGAGGAPTPAFGRPMPMAPEESECGGCAAKVGLPVLERALARLPPAPADASEVLGLGAADDAAAFTTAHGDLVVASVDAFRAPTDDPYLVGRVAAVNALADLDATGALPRHALAMVAVPRAESDDEACETLHQVLAGARAAFDARGVTLLGGHTTTAAELLVGFTACGAARGERLLTLRGLRPGDRLLLTKPLGTGVVLHADMQGRAPGRWVEAALASMAASTGPAGEVAAHLGASAATDVTGFGLLGHLARMLEASQVAAVLHLERLPALPGACALLAQGLASTFHPANRRAFGGLLDAAGRENDPRLALLFDPQTAGGLLFGLAPDRVERALALLPDAVAIGEVVALTSGRPRVQVTA